MDKQNNIRITASYFLLTLLFVLVSLYHTDVQARIYRTNFPLTEDPISEGGNWVNGKTVGLDWTNVSTISGRAIGNYTSGSPKYNDPTAILVGNWGPNQTVQATVFNVNPTDNYFQEVEIRLRTAVSAHSITGYEVLFRVSKTAKAYAQIVRWNGPLGNFTYLAKKKGAQYGVANGDVVRASIVGNRINAYINGALIISAWDNHYQKGNPGMGFNYGCGKTNTDFGFSDFMATDETLSPQKSHLSFPLINNRAL